MANIFQSKNILFYIIYVSLNILLIIALPNEQISDSLTYHQTAAEVAQLHEFYPHEHNLHDMYLWPSFYINALGSLYLLLGSNLLRGKVFNIILNCLTLLALIKTTSLIFGRKEQLFLYCIFIIYPNLYFMNILTLTESFFLAAFLWGNFLYIKIMTDAESRPASFMLCSALFTISIFIRPVALLVPFCLLIMAFEKKRSYSGMLTAIAVAVLLVGIYGTGTKEKLGTFNVLGTTSIYTFFLSNNQHATGRYSPEAETYVASFNSDALDVFAKEKLFLSHALHYIMSNPAQTVKHILKRPLYLFMYDGKLIETAFNEENKVDKISVSAIMKKLGKSPVASCMIFINQLVYMTLLFFICIGLGRLLRRKEYDKAVFVALPPLLILFATLAVVASTRFHYIIIIMSMPIAAYGMGAFLLKEAKQPAALAKI